MLYWIILKNRKGEPYHFYDSFLPGIISREKIEQIAVESIKNSEFCKSCPGSICHVIESRTGRKFCPILFHKLVQPPWRLKDLTGYKETFGRGARKN